MNIATNNRLQFVHCDTLFATREDAIAYVYEGIDRTRPSLYAEPMVLKYGNEQKPNILLVIGSVGDGVTPSLTNEVFFIDFADVEAKIADIIQEISQGDGRIRAISGLLLNVIESCGFTDDGHYVPYTESHIIGESTSLTDAVRVLADYLAEVEDATQLFVDNTNKAITLELNETPTGKTLSADVNLYEDDSVNNILQKTTRGTYLYVDGKAKNIEYIDRYGKYGTGAAQSIITVQEALDNAVGGIAPLESNIVNMKLNGLHAAVDISYDAPTNTLTFKRTNTSGEMVTTSFELASMSIADDITYDAVHNELVIHYTTGSSEIKTLRIPLTEVFKEFTVDNTNNTVTLDYHIDVEGSNVLKANVNISTLNDNILENQNHALFVRGTADNIRYENGTVENALDSILAPADTEGSMRNLVETLKTELLGDIEDTNANVATLQNDLTTEANTRLTADTAISNALNTKINAVSAATDSLASDLETDILTNRQQVDAEISLLSTNAAHSAATLTTALSTETNARIAKDTELTTKTTALETAVNTLNGNETVEGSVAKQVSDGVEQGVYRANAYTDSVSAMTLIEAKGYTDDVNQAVQTQLTNQDNRITSVEGRVSDAEDDIIGLQSRVSGAEADFVSTASVELVKDANKNVTANVKTSSLVAKNMVHIESDGLWATTDLDYDPNSNTLTFKSSGNADKSIILNTVQTITRMYYDTTNKQLVIVYQASGGTEQDVRINVSDLFNGVIGSEAGVGHNVDVTVTPNAQSQSVITANVNFANIVDNSGNVEFSVVNDKLVANYERDADVVDALDDIAQLQADVAVLSGGTQVLINHEHRITQLESENAILSGKVAELEAKINDPVSGLNAMWDAIHMLQQNVVLYDATESDEGAFEFVDPVDDPKHMNRTGIKFTLDTTDLNNEVPEVNP